LLTRCSTSETLAFLATTPAGGATWFHNTVELLPRHRDPVVRYTEPQAFPSCWWEVVRSWKLWEIGNPAGDKVSRCSRARR
jgi:hypothetical protein